MSTLITQYAEYSKKYALKKYIKNHLKPVKKLVELIFCLKHKTELNKILFKFICLHVISVNIFLRDIQLANLYSSGSKQNVFQLNLSAQKNVNDFWGIQ